MLIRSRFRTRWDCAGRFFHSSRNTSRRRRPRRPRSGGCRREVALAAELLEDRTLLATNLQIPLDPVFDTFGFQPETVQAYRVPGTDDYKVGLTSIFDTGASVVTFSAVDQLLFETATNSGIPIKVPGGAEAQGVGGTLTGDVSQPGTVLVDGAHINVFSAQDILGGGGAIYFDQLPGIGQVDDTSPSAGQFRGNAALSDVDGAYNGFSIVFRSGLRADEVRTIASYNGATRTFTLATPLSGPPANGDTFHIIVGQGSVTDTLPARDRFAGSANLSDTTGEYVGRHLLFTSGALAGQSQLINGYDGATNTFELALPFSQRPETGDTFDIVVGTGSSAVMPGVQAFVGTFEGSKFLPTIAGTPM
ncbi:MAG: hypothetical protein GXP27_18685, partial [Planctomycetes bacterium]|nr:hypothetical protein [Planctomycetota bacterium]